MASRAVPGPGWGESGMYPTPSCGAARPTNDRPTTILILDSDPSSPALVSPSNGCWLMRPAFTGGERWTSSIGEEGGTARVEMDAALDAVRLRGVRNVGLHASRTRRRWLSHRPAEGEALYFGRNPPSERASIRCNGFSKLVGRSLRGASCGLHRQFASTVSRTSFRCALHARNVLTALAFHPLPVAVTTSYCQARPDATCFSTARAVRPLSY